MPTHRERALAVLNYAGYDRLPVLHFGFWRETLMKWAMEGHLSREEALGAAHIVDFSAYNEIDRDIESRLGFDFDWENTYPGEGTAGVDLLPRFEERLEVKLPDGALLVQNRNGVTILQKPGVASIPSEVDHLLKDRASWEEHYLPRVQYSALRVDFEALTAAQTASAARGLPLGLYCGSMIGRIREWCGLVGLSYLFFDNEALVDEMINVYADLCYQVVAGVLATGVHFDYGHFWEDMAYKGGPLISPTVFAQKLAPHYKRITDLLHDHGVSIVSLDCDGLIDKLVPIWLSAGVNTMFPIEVGTWGASVRPWRERYGPELRGVGGMDKRVFARDRHAIDAEIERLKPLVDLGGYIPCPDHLVPPDAEWENVRYYCDRFRTVFG